MVARKADFYSPAGSRPIVQGIPWSTASVQSRGLIFMVTNSATIQLDSIVLCGPGLADLAPRR